MINTEHLIKRRIVSDAAYNRESDEEDLYEDINSRMRQQKRARQRQKRLYDPKYFDNDSDFESSDDEKKNNDDNNINKLLYGIKQSKLKFDKIAINNNGKIRDSNLSQLIQSCAPVFNSQMANGRKDELLERNYSKYARYEPEIEHSGGVNGHSGRYFNSFILTIYFSEYLNEEPIKLEITEAWTVNETIIKCIEKWGVERPLNKLKSHSPNNYLMRGVEIDMDEVEIEEDVPAFGKHLKINTLNEKFVGLQYINIVKDNNFVGDSKNKVMEFKNAKEQLLVRVTIPGPNNEAHVLAIDKDATALTLRDLISLLNKKKHGAHFHAQYFKFFFDNGKTSKNDTKKEILSLAKCILDLNEPRQLILLPKFLGPNDDINEAYNFRLVRLANETREYHCTKIRNARKNKKRLLIVNKHRIVKKAMDDYNIGTNDHKPIDIISIIDIHIVDKDNKQFSIEYRKPQAGGIRQQIYELESERECKHFVDKVKYLRTLRQLQQSTNKIM